MALPRLLLCLIAALASAQTWTPEFSLKFQAVGGVTPSPDGSLVVYTATRHIIEGERSEQVSQIFLAKADGSARCGAKARLPGAGS